MRIEDIVGYRVGHAIFDAKLATAGFAEALGVAPFPAQYAEHHAVIAIDTGKVLVGELPSRALKLVNEWATLHRAELGANSRQARNGGTPEPIDPLS